MQIMNMSLNFPLNAENQGWAQKSPVCLRQPFSLFSSKSFAARQRSWAGLLKTSCIPLWMVRQPEKPWGTPAFKVGGCGCVCVLCGGLTDLPFPACREVVLAQRWPGQVSQTALGARSCLIRKSQRTWGPSQNNCRVWERISERIQIYKHKGRGEFFGGTSKWVSRTQSGGKWKYKPATRIFLKIPGSDGTSSSGKLGQHLPLIGLTGSYS